MFNPHVFFRKGQVLILILLEVTQIVIPWPTYFKVNVLILILLEVTQIKAKGDSYFLITVS